MPDRRTARQRARIVAYRARISGGLARRSTLAVTLLTGLALGGLGGLALAGTTGTICGHVSDKAQRPAEFATVNLAEMALGAFADARGDFCVVRIPPGTYDVVVSRLGYETTRVKGVVVSADHTTRLEVELGEKDIVTEEVVVMAERPPVDLNLTSTATHLTSEQIEALPIQELQDVVNLQAGVVEGHFRGGRLGEVQYQVDGVTVNNAYDNASMLRIDRSLLQEVQVISGTFDAEYGQAMSGVVNAVLKEGTEDFRWSGEMYGGDFVFPARDDPRARSPVHPGAIQNWQLTLRGPAPLPRTVFLLSGRDYDFNDYVEGTRHFLPTDSSDFEHKIFRATGDGEQVALGYTRQRSGTLKVTNTSIPGVKVNYQLVMEDTRSRRSAYGFRLNPDGLSTQRSLAVSHGFDWSQMFGASTLLDVKLRQNYLNYRDFAYEDLFDPRYDQAGPPLGDRSYELGAYVQGVEFTRFRQRSNVAVLKGILTKQTMSGHGLKLGGEVFRTRIEFGHPGYLTYTTVEGRLGLVRHVDEPPDYPGVRMYWPMVAAGFLQDQVEWRPLMVRAGLRLDYFDARATVPSDPANPANAIAGVPASYPRPTSKKIALSPRLGVAFPVVDQAALHFAYGHFRQFPAIGEMFSNADYSVLARLQAGAVSYGVLGNPDVRPEMTVQYEVGYKQALTENFGADITAFYKDIRDLLGVELVSTYNGAEYARLTNVDFGSVLGFTLSLDHRRIGPAAIALDYTWQQALGNASDPRETATRAAAGEDPRPRLVPFNWDQRHTLNLTVSVAGRGGVSASAVLRAASGQPYTPILEAGFGHGMEANSGRKPASAVADVRLEKQLGSRRHQAALFARIFNLTDAKYFNGSVFASTGSPYYSRFPEADAVTLADPTRLYPPRRIEIGLRLGSEGL